MTHDLLHILSDPAHWIGEFVMDATFAVPAYFFGRWRVKVHDRDKHGIH